jgi:DNA-binding MarR family transcriptional regulator
MSRESQIQEIIEFTSRLHRPMDPHVMQKVGLSPAQSGMLVMLFYRRGASMKELASYISVSKSAITQLLEPLIEKGLVSRTPNPNDKRQAVLRITPAGKQKLKQLKQHKAEGMRIALSVLGDHELDQLRKIYEKLTLNINKQRLEVKE